MQNFNLHTHSIYSDGKSTPREHVEEAVRQGLTRLGFSEHSPLPFDNNFSVKSDRMPDYIKEIAALKEEYKDRIEILCGLEADYITGVSESFALTKEKYQLDYLIGGVHLVGQSANPEELWFIDGPKCPPESVSALLAVSERERHQCFFHPFLCREHSHQHGPLQAAGAGPGIL